MSRPFDEARYAGLLEGLEATETPYSTVATGTETKRFDPEYFNRAALLAQRRLQDSPLLGDLVKDGYRVVYETTQAIDRNVGIKAGLPFFLQATDISTPFIDTDSMNCVSEEDWRRYPKGRIQRGELLIEVKGRAEKIAIVPDDIPSKTLVTGTCFKLTTIEADDRFLLTAYLTCKYGQALKERLKTNLLVSYLAKGDLYSLPVPRVSIELRSAIKRVFEKCFAENSHAKREQQKGEQFLLSTLGLDQWQPSEPQSYNRRASEVFAAGRLDAQFFDPRVDELLAHIEKRFPLVALASTGEILKGASVPYHEDGTIPIVRSGDLKNIQDESSFLRTIPTEAVFYLQVGDLLVSSIGFGSIGKVQVFDKPGRYGTVGEVTVVRQKQFNPHYLACFLRSIAGQEQFERYITGATGQLHLYPRDVGKIMVPDLSEERQKEFEAIANDVELARHQSKRLLKIAERAVEIAIEKDDSSALTFLASNLES